MPVIHIHALTTAFYVLLLTVATVAAPSAEVAPETAMTLSRLTAQDVFGSLGVATVTPYFDADLNASVYAVEFEASQGSPAVTVIASARHDDVPVVMMWSGPAKHRDEQVLEMMRDTIRQSLGVEVTAPEIVIWLDLYAVYGVYAEMHPETNEQIICNLYTGELASLADLQEEWADRMDLVAAGEKAYVATSQGAAKSYASSNDPRLARSRARFEHVRSRWDAADRLLRESPGALDKGNYQALQAPSPNTRYIENVPNLNMMNDLPPDVHNGGCSDCGTVAAMNILLYWDKHGYDRLVDPGEAGLRALRRQLWIGMWHDCGAGLAGAARGLDLLTNHAVFGRQYDFDITDIDNASFNTLRTEIDQGRPAWIGVMDYTQDSRHSRDYDYGNHAMCAVGYFQGGLPEGSWPSGQWVLLHDGWGGGIYTNPYVVDNTAYIDWQRAQPSMISVKPGPEGLTYPNTENIIWQPGQTQRITWIGETLNNSSTILSIQQWAEVNLLNGSIFQNSLLSVGAPQAPAKSALCSVPATLSPGSNYAIRIDEQEMQGRSTATILLTLTGKPFEISLLASAVDAPADLVFDTFGDAKWFRQTTQVYSGQDAVQSGAIGHGQQSAMETLVIGPGTIRFKWRTSSETNYDGLVFFVDYENSGTNLSGTTSWQTVSMFIPQGLHSLAWAYAKDGSASHGADCGWVDAVEWIPALPEAVDNTSLKFATSIDSPFLNGCAAWTRQTGLSYNDGDVAQSGDIGNDSVSWMQTMVRGSGFISFRWKVSSQQNHDYLEFYVDGKFANDDGLMSRISGERGWESKNLLIESDGTHVLTWRYIKDNSGSSGQDCGWVDKVEWSPILILDDLD